MSEDALPTAPSPWVGRRLGWLVGALTFLTAAAALVLRAVLTEPPLPEHVRFVKATQRIDRISEPEVRDEVRKLIRGLDDAAPHPEIFSGGVDFLYGLVYFHDARVRESSYEDQNGFAPASKRLLRAERSGLPVEYRSTWAEACGLSLSHTDPERATDVLLEAWRLKTSLQEEIGQRLLRCVLQAHDREKFDEALAVSEQLLERDLSAKERLGVMRDRCDLALRTGRRQLAQDAFDQLPDRGTDANRLFEGRLLMAEERWEDASKKLEPLTKRRGLARVVPRTASVLLGLCAEQLGDDEAAVDWWQAVVRTTEGDAHSLAAGLWSARVLQRNTRSEEALANALHACGAIETTLQTGSPWLTTSEIDALLTERIAWWIDAGEFERALLVTDAAAGLWSPVEAARRRVTVREAWTNDAQLTFDSRRRSGVASATQEERLYRLWSESGRAWADLANEASRTEEIVEAVWRSAEHYRAAHEFRLARKQIEKFLELHRGQRVPLAYVRRGQLAIALDRLDDAERDFRVVLDQYPSTPARYEAAVWLGRCLLEQGLPEEARTVWESLLGSNDLSPEAREWRQAAFGLAELIYHDATHQGLALAAGPPEDGTQPKTAYAKVAREFADAAERLDLLLRRYPDDANTDLVRYYLARCHMQLAADHAREASLAETENTRQDLLARQADRLRLAVENFGKLLDALKLPGRGETPSRLQTDLHRMALLQKALALQYKGDFEEAIQSYNAFVNVYPSRPESILAYLQMSECHYAASRTDEGGSLQKQAELILTQLPDDSFAPPAPLTREDWLDWLRDLKRDAP